jgi:hypothetical protein
VPLARSNTDCRTMSLARSGSEPQAGSLSEKGRNPGRGQGGANRTEPHGHSGDRTGQLALAGCLGGFTMGPDGAVWFTEIEKGVIGRISALAYSR